MKVAGFCPLLITYYLKLITSLALHPSAAITFHQVLHLA